MDLIKERVILTLDLDNYFANLCTQIRNSQQIEKLYEVERMFTAQRSSGKRLLLFGNGAAASIASHAALDMTKQGGLVSLCFHDSALLTAFANDYGYQNAFKEIIRAYHQEDDICVFLSVSGESPNIVEAAKFAREVGLKVIGFSGRSIGNSLSQNSDVSLWVDSHAYNIVENTHSSWLLALVDMLLGESVYEVS